MWTWLARTSDYGRWNANTGVSKSAPKVLLKEAKRSVDAVEEKDEIKDEKMGTRRCRPRRRTQTRKIKPLPRASASQRRC